MGPEALVIVAAVILLAMFALSVLGGCIVAILHGAAPTPAPDFSPRCGPTVERSTDLQQPSSAPVVDPWCVWCTHGDVTTILAEFDRHAHDAHDRAEHTAELASLAWLDTHTEWAEPDPAPPRGIPRPEQPS